MRIYGRENFIEQLWTTLEEKGVVLSAERRMGKTCVIQKMAETATTRHGKTCLAIYQDLESVGSTREFVDQVFQKTRPYLKIHQSTFIGGKQFLSSLGGLEIAKVVKLPAFAEVQWKPLLTEIIECLVKNHSLVILFWDEFPVMLSKIAKDAAGEQTAMEILDTLRQLRQSHPAKLRMVFTGSIGIHLVLSTLKRRGYMNEPINDMHVIEVGPLSETDASEFVKVLLESAKLDSAEEYREQIVECVDRIPFYIQELVRFLQFECGGKKVEASVALQDCISKSLGVWNFEHYVERINSYYEPADRELALLLLDEFARKENGHKLNEITKIASKQSFNEEQIKQVTLLLKKDHYLNQSSDGTMTMKYSFVRKWWKMHRC